MKHVYIIRNHFFDQQASLGHFWVFEDDAPFHSFNQPIVKECAKLLIEKRNLERGWVNNANRISCVPVGDYPYVFEYSDRFKKMLWELKNVPNRSECKTHAFNFWWQSNGCNSLGNNKKDIDGDLIMDLTNSRNAMKDFHHVMRKDTKAILHIRNVLDL